MRDQSLKIENARYVVTVDTQRRIIQDGSILIEGGRISGVGKAADLAGARADRVIDARHRVVTPGFFNGHMHISYAHAVRGIFPDDLGSPLVHVFNLQAAMTEEEEYYTSLLAIVELVKNGTVCFVDPGSTKFPEACRATRRARRSRARRRSSRSGMGASRAASPRGRCRSHLRLAAPICSVGSSKSRTSTGPASRCTTGADRRRERNTWRVMASAQPSTSNRSARWGRTSSWPTRSASTTPRSTAWRGPGRAWRCAPSRRPREGAGSRSTVGCPSSWPRA